MSSVTVLPPTPSSSPLPRVTIQFCTQCKWMLRAAYFAQELLSTFSTSLGEVALQPSTGGTFTVKLYHASPEPSEQVDDSGVGGEVEVKEYILWDRKTEGGFPETKELKKRVRDVIDPKRDLGHVDGKKNSTTQSASQQTTTQTQVTTVTNPDDGPSQPLAIKDVPQALETGTTRKEPEPKDTDAASERASQVSTSKESNGGSCKTGEVCEDCD